MKPHHWPHRHFTQVGDSIGITLEPAGHNEAGEPRTTLYRSDTQEEKVITEAEAKQIIKHLQNPNRKFYE